MTSQVSVVVTDCDKDSALPTTPQRRWLRWIVGIGMLLLTSGLMLHRINQKHISQLEQAAEQIQLGSDWKLLCDENKDLWENWLFCVSESPPNREEYFYGRKSSRYLTELGWALPDWSLINRFSGNLHIRSQCPVSIVVDQNGNGKVIGVRIRETWRGKNLSSPAVLSPSR